MKSQNPAVKYGLIGAILLVTIGITIQLLLLNYLKHAVETPEKFSVGTFALIGIASLVLIVGIFVYCIVKSMKDYRKLDVEYNYRKLAAQGLLVTLILVIVSTGCSYLYSNVIAPESKQQALDLTKQLYQSIKMPEEQREKMLERLNNQNPTRDLLTSTGLTLLLGMIISLVGATILNRRNYMNPNQMR